MPAKHTFEHVKNEFTKENCTLLSTKYINQNEILKYKCSCGSDNIYSVTYKNFMNGQRCCLWQA